MWGKGVQAGLAAARAQNDDISCVTVCCCMYGENERKEKKGVGDPNYRTRMLWTEGGRGQARQDAVKSSEPAYLTVLTSLVGWLVGWLVAPRKGRPPPCPPCPPPLLSFLLPPSSFLLSWKRIRARRGYKYNTQKKKNPPPKINCHKFSPRGDWIAWEIFFFFNLSLCYIIYYISIATRATFLSLWFAGKARVGYV